MKAFKSSTALVLLSTVLIACSDDWQEENSNYLKQTVQICTSIKGYTNTRSNPASNDAAWQSIFNSDDKLAVDNGQQTGIYTYNEKIKIWDFLSGKQLEWKEGTNTFKAFYPADNNTASFSAFTVPANQSDRKAIASADYMTGTATYSTIPEDLTLQLNMQRQMARVIVTIAGFSKEYTHQYPSITQLNIRSGYTTTIPGSAASGSPVDITPLSGGVEGGITGSTYTALVVPGIAQNEEDFITLQVNDGEGNTLDAKVTGIPETLPGKSYTYQLTITKNTIHIGQIEIEDWTDATIPGGEATSQPGETETDVPNYKEHTIVMQAPATLTEEQITSTIGPKGELAIVGPMENQRDLYTLRNWAYDHMQTDNALRFLDLSGVTGWNRFIEYAFRGIQSIQEIILPASVKEIGTCAFQECTSLKNINLENIEQLGSYALSSCRLLDKANLSNVQILGHNAFEFCSTLKEIHISEHLASIESETFLECTSLASIDIKNVTKIGGRAFWHCTALTAIDLSNITQIDEKAFWQCSALTAAHIDKLSVIEPLSFYSCKSLTSLEIGEQTSIIKENAFEGCISLKTLDLKNVTTIENRAFSGCEQLAVIHLDKVSSIGANAFQSCKSLQHINLSALTHPLNASFLNCSSLQSVILGEQTTSIGTEAFSGCTALTDIDLKNITTIEKKAFYDCTTLANPNLQKAVAIKEQAFMNCQSISKIIAPNLLKIGAYAFTYCGTIEQTDFSNVEEIGFAGFFRVQIENLNLPKCTIVGPKAFMDSTIGTLRLTADSDITIAEQALDFTTEQTALCLHENKKAGSATAFPAVDSNGLWSNKVWKNIQYSQNEEPVQIL